MVRKVNNLRKSSNPNSNRQTLTDFNVPTEADIGYVRNFYIIRQNLDENSSSNSLNLNNTKTQKNFITEINSEVDMISSKYLNIYLSRSDFSDETSSFSINSLKTLNTARSENFLSHDTEIIPKCLATSASSSSLLNTQEMKAKYRDFVKILLKVKFEKIHSTHNGQQIPEKVLFKKCIDENIPHKNWADFILSEMKQPQKYAKYMKTSKLKKSYRSLPNKQNIISIFHRGEMTVINEEN